MEKRNGGQCQGTQVLGMFFVRKRVVWAKVCVHVQKWVVLLCEWHVWFGVWEVAMGLRVGWWPKENFLGWIGCLGGWWKLRKWGKE
jgi:hypothetical protein